MRARTLKKAHGGICAYSQALDVTGAEAKPWEGR